MTALTWQAVGIVDPRRLAEARHQSHNAAQWLARIAHSYLKPEPENRHTLLHWDPKRQALVTREFAPRLTLELRLPDLTLQFREADRPAPHVIEMDDRTPAEVEAWVLVELLHRQLDRDRFSKALPCEIPNLMSGDAIPYQTETLEPALAELTAWLANAALVLAHVADEYLPKAPGVSAVRCWPEIFHMAVLLPARTDTAGSKQMLRAGLSLGNADRAEPCFYVAPHAPLAAPPDSILPTETILSSERPAESVLRFLRKAIAVYRERAAK